MLPLIVVPQPILRQVVKPVPLPISDTVLNLAQEMVTAMRHYHGIGLAAPQVNKDLRLIIVATTPEPTAYINPEIIKSSWRKLEMEEGCLSIPGVYGLVRRPVRVLVRYVDLRGNVREEWMEDLVARIYQHEVDHLNGVLFVDKASAITRGRDLLSRYGLE